METYGHVHYARILLIYNVQGHLLWLLTTQSTEWCVNIALGEKISGMLAHLLMETKVTETKTPPLTPHMRRTRETLTTKTCERHTHLRGKGTPGQEQDQALLVKCNQ